MYLQTIILENLALETPENVDNFIDQLESIYNTTFTVTRMGNLKSEGIEISDGELEITMYSNNFFEAHLTNELFRIAQEGKYKEGDKLHLGRLNPFVVVVHVTPEMDIFKMWANNTTIAISKTIHDIAAIYHPHPSIYE